MSEYKGILIYCESFENRLSSISIELLGAGTRLAKDLGQKVNAVLIGNTIGDLAQEAIYFGADKVYVVSDPFLKDYLPDTYLEGMDKVVKLLNPQILLMGQTLIGRDLAPRLAFRFNTAATLDCLDLKIDPASKQLLQTKPVYGGNAQATYVCNSYPQIATVRSKAMLPLERDTNRKGEVINIAAGIDSSSVRMNILDRKFEMAGGIKLEDAKVIVCGGRGIGDTEGFKQLEELAKMLNGAFGATRPPCDNHWVPDSLQIGLTGKIVSPDIYIAVALSGSSQHLSGCGGSRLIIAINKDADANIFKVAHLGVVADWKKALPAFAAKVKQFVNTSSK
jgi:electron transfer flavoprotein alpha subunit